MIVKIYALTVLTVFLSTLCDAAEQKKGPMNPDWFYGQNVYMAANLLHQNEQWEGAEKLYKELLQENAGDEYDQANAMINLAACSWAQRKATNGWKAFDDLIDIEKKQLLCPRIIENAKEKEKKSVLIKTNQVGIGDIFGFMEAAKELKNRTDWDITLAVPHFLKSSLAGVDKAYNIHIIGTNDEQPKVDCITHIISLPGHLELHPSSLIPEKVVLTPSESAQADVNQQLAPFLSTGKTIAAVFLGEDRAATLIGGKQLPRDQKKHGRHLDSEPFMKLLSENPDLVLIDCRTKASQIKVDDDKKSRCVPLAAEREAFDTVVALAAAMNNHKNIVAFGADNGPTNVFIRALSKEAQKRMAIIIPAQCDMRTEGPGNVYKQSISECNIYKCGEPKNQAAVIAQAYKDMTK
jgi:hypothetical protein